MFTKKHYQEIITKNMAANVESELNAAIAEDAFVRHFHVIKGKTLKGIRRIVAPRVNGITIIVKEQSGAFSYQVATCSRKDLFARRAGRYYAYTRALEQGFVEVPPIAFHYLPEDATLEQKERAVVNYYIQTVVNFKPPVSITLPGVNKALPLHFVNKDFLVVFEDILQSILPEGATIAYSHYKKTETTTVRVVEDVSLRGKLDEVSVQELQEFLATKPSASVVRYAKDSHHKWVARYHALYKLFTQLTS